MTEKIVGKDENELPNGTSATGGGAFEASVVTNRFFLVRGPFRHGMS